MQVGISTTLHFNSHSIHYVTNNQLRNSEYPFPSVGFSQPRPSKYPCKYYQIFMYTKPNTSRKSFFYYLWGCCGDTVLLFSSSLPSPLSSTCFPHRTCSESPLRIRADLGTPAVFLLQNKIQSKLSCLDGSVPCNASHASCPLKLYGTQ